MFEIHDRLFIGDETHCSPDDEGWATVHACKHPCHQRAVGYTGSLRKNHPNYLILEAKQDLYLNMIDPPVPLFPDELFHAGLKFIEHHWNDGKNILVHCNQGQSRAPSLALLFLALNLGEIPDNSYAAARTQFDTMYPGYQPGKGIQTKLTNDWARLADS